LARKEAAHAAKTREDDRLWARVVEEEKSEARKKAVSAAKRAAAKQRETMARRGGEARSEKLDPARRVEIARASARARWARWRAEHGTRDE
jgi:hypothetical protein